MPAWEYCYVNESLQPADGGRLVRDYFIARPDRAETRGDLAENQMLELLGNEGWELVAVVPVQTRYFERRSEIGGMPHPSSMQGSTDVSSTTYYFKRLVAT